MKKCKLKNLKEGDSFRFADPKNKTVKTWVVEGQYPVNHITTVFSESNGKITKDEPIAVRNSHEVVLVTSGKYSIEHRVLTKQKSVSGNNKKSKPSGQQLKLF